jgi:rhodanese-related sulfurtransferase
MSFFTVDPDTEIDVHAVGSLTGAVLLDVREDDEWAAGHMPGAVHVRMGLLRADHPALKHGHTIVCICRSGNRSRRVTDALRHAGFDAKNMTGGMFAWASAGFPVVNQSGEPGTVI